jgi:hypothetical protein
MHAWPPSTVGEHPPCPSAQIPFAQHGNPIAPHVVQAPAVQPQVGDTTQVPARLSFRQQPPLSQTRGVQQGWLAPPQALVQMVPPASVSRQTMCAPRQVSPP